jgi:hypothetical protein
MQHFAACSMQRYCSLQHMLHVLAACGGLELVVAALLQHAAQVRLNFHRFIHFPHTKKLKKMGASGAEFQE